MPGKFHKLRAPVAALVLLASGCTSVPPPQTEEPTPVADAPAAEEAKTPPADPKAATAESAADSPAKQAAAPQEKPAPAPKPKPAPKPWKTEFTAGSHLAKVDGVQVYLGLPAVSKWRQKTAAAAPLDQKHTIAPLLKGRDRPLVRGRALRVCIDPGHGGEDSGATSRDGALAEKTVALDIAKRLRKMLLADGAEVMLTRESDAAYPTLDARVAKAKKWKADLFVSIHLNANAGHAPRGVETYVFTAPGMESTSYQGSKPSPESRATFPGNSHDAGSVQLGFCIQRRLVAASGMPDRGLRRARFVVLRDAGMPAALVECGFITNAKDLAAMKTAAGLSAVARGVYEGICDFALGTMAPGLPAHVSGEGGLGKEPAG
ncbi:MAG: N-acetylmuramoyl-L-alanine amidase, partial [Kiritimatiellae bacterium]|nr:N-acetylmuramoyl-L-alanine amidase [Kiritimatiellia bacterium]